jgi:hypothetical protein
MGYWFIAVAVHWFHLLVADALNLGTVGVIVSICAVIGGGILHFLVFVLKKIEATNDKIDVLSNRVSAWTGQTNGGGKYRKGD